MHYRSSFNKFFMGLCLGGALTVSLPLNAAQLDFWATDGWSVLDAEDGVAPGNYVGPGWGGQAFDAEYLFYKRQGSLLSVGLQSGFDLLDGQQNSSGMTYYAGDLALAFDSGPYEYAVDFGLVTRDIDGNNVGLGSGNQDSAGVYAVSLWNNNISFDSSSPFAMDEGSFLADISMTSGSELMADGLSFYRTVTFDLADLGLDPTAIGAHWTMSCGNDVVEGVPEPGSLLLMLGGLFGLVGSKRLLRTRA